MECETVQTNLSAWIDGEPVDAGVLFHHVGDCTDCRDFLQGAIRVHASMAATPAPHVPASLDARIRRLLGGELRRTDKPAVRWWGRRISVPVPAAAISALLLLAAVTASMFLWTTPGGIPPVPPRVVYMMSMDPVVIESEPLGTLVPPVLIEAEPEGTHKPL